MLNYSLTSEQLQVYDILVLWIGVTVSAKLIQIFTKLYHQM